MYFIFYKTQITFFAQSVLSFCLRLCKSASLDLMPVRSSPKFCNAFSYFSVLTLEIWWHQKSVSSNCAVQYVSNFIFVVVFKEVMKFSINLFFKSATKSVSNGCGSFCITNPKGAKMACSDRHQDGFCRNASPMFSRKIFFSSLSFPIPHNLFQYFTIICSLKNAKGSLATSP
jgi:hypothetical protein